MSLHVVPPRAGSNPDQAGADDQTAVAPPGLPQALEEALAFKHERAMQVGANPADVDRLMAERQAEMEAANNAENEISRSAMVEEEDENAAGQPKDDTKAGNNQRGGKKNKKKKKKKNRPEQWAREAAEAERRKREEEEEKEKEKSEEAVEVEYVTDKLDMDPADPMFR